MRKATNKNNINFDKYQHLPIKVEKIEDTQFDGEHPNGYLYVRTWLDTKG